MLAAEKTIYTNERIEELGKYPHLIGHLAGKDKLTELHSYWIKYIWDSNEERSLQAHRGSYKTTAIVAIGTIRWLLFNPNDRIAIIRKTFTDAAEVVDAICNMMQMREIQELFYAVHGVFPEFRTKRFGKLEFCFKRTVTPEGSVNAHGLDASLTGKHYDKIICDDFVTLRDRISKTERERTHTIIREIRTNIIDAGKPVSYIGTPWHKYDAWRLLPEPILFDVYLCNILSYDEIEDKKRKTTPSLFSANYKLKHQADENTLFVDPKYERWVFSNKNKIYAQLDAAFDGDHTNGLTIMAQHETDSNLLRAVGFCYGGNVKDWKEKIITICKKYRVKYLYNETNPDKGFTADLLRGNGIIIKEYTESMNKHNKIATYLYERWDDILWDIATEDDYMEQVLDYEKGAEPDDCPDSAASLLKMVFSKKQADSGSLYKW